jgi:hypothetical protein
MSEQSRAKHPGPAQPPLAARPSGTSVDLYWLPLGAGGDFVRFNGRIYEGICAYREHRRPFDLYHSALQVRVREGRSVIEMGWPIPDRYGSARGVVVEGPVGTRALAKFRLFRYEVRRWRDGVIPDILDAVASPQRLSENPDEARRVLDLVGSVPRLVWGRTEPALGDMWNSNSVISWVLVAAGVDVDQVTPPYGGRAPGWDAGVGVARGKVRGGASGLPELTLRSSG